MQRPHGHQSDNRLKIEDCKNSPGIIWFCISCTAFSGVFFSSFFVLLPCGRTKAGLTKLSLCPTRPHSPFHVQNHSISPPPFPVIYILTGRGRAGRDALTLVGASYEVTVPEANTAYANLYLFIYFFGGEGAGGSCSYVFRKSEVKREFFVYTDGQGFFFYVIHGLPKVTKQNVKFYVRALCQCVSEQEREGGWEGKDYIAKCSR